MFRTVLNKNGIALLAFVLISIGFTIPVHANQANSMKSNENKTNSLRSKSRLSPLINKPNTNRLNKSQPNRSRTKSYKIRSITNGSIFSKPIRVSEAFGVNYSFPDPHPKAGELEMLAETGVRWVRISMSWGYIEKNKGKYDFDAYDKIFADFEKYNLQPLVGLDSNGQTNYSNKSNTYPYPPDTPEAQQAFTNWAVAVTQRYKGRGIVWEMYNEPNNSAFWPPDANVRDYSQLALMVGKAIKQNTPNEILIGPALLHTDYNYLEEVLKTGVLSFWNGVSVHLYRSAGSPETASSDYKTFQNIIQKYNSSGANIPIISGEWGYPNFNWNGVSYNEDIKARFLARQWLINLTNNVPISIWFEWKEPPQTNQFNSGSWGLVGNKYYPGRNPAYDAKPAYFASKTLITSLKDYAFSKRIKSTSDTNYILEFTNVAQTSKRKAYAIWRDSETPIKVKLPITSGQFKVISLLGENLGTIKGISQGVSIEISGSPKYLIPAP
jgi:polysaccharide biosynthesis protein PslG